MPAILPEQQILKPIGMIGIMGRNGSDPSFVIPDHQCLEAYNVDWYRSSFGHKRGGATIQTFSGGTAAASGYLAGCRHVPGSDETAAEMWTVDGANNVHRMAGSSSFADITITDAISATPQEVAFKSFNGKLYCCYKSAHNRLHVWDPVDAKLRRAGLDKAATPSFSVAAGTLTDTRKWRVAFTKQISGVTVLRGELSVATASQALATQKATINRPTPPGEGETHWEVWAASTSSVFADYRLQATATIATTTQDDNVVLGSTVAPADGSNTLPPSARYLTSDDSRLIMGGSYEATTNTENAMVPSVHRVWWTPSLGTTDVGDDERISNTGTINGYADIEEAITAISEPLQVVTAASSSFERGSFYVFSYRSQWKFVATGVVTSPYLKFRVSGGGGCVHHKSLVSATDTNGNPAIYWWSPDGPMRISTNGQEFCGEDLADLIPTVNLDATIPCHAVVHRSLHQVWFYIATGSNTYPNKRVTFDYRLGKVTDITGVRMGWSVAEGESTKAYCSFMFSDTVGASMGHSLKPYIGYTGATALWKCDTTALDDGGTAFQAYIDSKSYAPWGLGSRGTMVNEALLLANASTGVRILMTIYKDEGAESFIGRADLTPRSDSASELKVMRKLEGSRMAHSFSFRCRVGDETAVATAWNIDAVVVPVAYAGPV